MKNVSQKKGWSRGAVQMHLDPPPITIIKSNNNVKLDKYCVKTKLRSDPTSEKSDLYDFKMSLFDNGYPEVFLLFIQFF